MARTTIAAALLASLIITGSVLAQDDLFDEPPRDEAQAGNPFDFGEDAGDGEAQEDDPFGFSDEAVENKAQEDDPFGDVAVDDGGAADNGSKRRPNRRKRAEPRGQLDELRARYVEAINSSSGSVNTAEVNRLLEQIEAQTKSLMGGGVGDPYAAEGGAPGGGGYGSSYGGAGGGGEGGGYGSSNGGGGGYGAGGGYGGGYGGYGGGGYGGGGGGYGSGYGDVYGGGYGDSPDDIDNKLRRQAALLVDQLQPKKAEMDSAITKALRKVLAELYDHRVKQRETQLKELEKKMADLRSTLERQRAAKDEVVDLRLRTVVNQARGIGF